MNASSAVLVILIITLSIILIVFMSTSDPFKNMVTNYKLPVLSDKLVPDIQSATVPRMRMKMGPSSEEPSSSEESPSSEEGWLKPAPDESILLKNLYKNEKQNFLYGNLKLVTDQQKQQEQINEETLISRLNNASNSMFLNSI